MINAWAERGDGALGPSRLSTRLFVAAACLSLVAWVAAQRLAPPEAVPWTSQMQTAAARMTDGLAVVGQVRAATGGGVQAADPNRTGLIGPEYADLFTTLGSIEAKRTTTNPDVAALMAHLLAEAGVGQGDRVAVGASGSFPALLLATLVAAEALGAEPVVVLSLGASSFGLTDPAFDLLHLHHLLVEGGVVRTPPAAASLGGDGDVGRDFEPSVRERMEERLAASGVAFLQEPDLERSVARRMEAFGGGDIAVFVNIGGADANVGTSPTILSLAPGLHASGNISLPPRAQRGALHAMAAAGVPVIHLLDIRSLAQRHGLPWDPIPLPGPGTTPLTTGAESHRATLLLIAGIWLAAMVILGAAGVIIPMRRSEPDPP